MCCYKVIAKLLYIVIVVLLFTVYNVYKSKHIGRLSCSPGYDDCCYLLSGQQLINELSVRGFTGFKSFLDNKGLHAPYSTIIAALSLWVSHGKIASVYYANGIIILLYLLGISYYIWNFRPLQFAVFILLFLSPLILTMGIVEFRPDILWGLLTGFTAVWIITEEKLFTNYKSCIFVGMLLGMDLLVKPSTFALSLLVISGALLSRPLNYYFMQRKHEQLKKGVIGLILIISVVVAIAGPYIYKYGFDIWTYFITNTFGPNKELWATKLSFLESLNYYISGPGAADNLGPSGYFFPFLFFTLIANIIIQKKAYIYNSIILLIALICTIAVNAISDLKGPFSGGVIYGLLLFGSAYLVGQHEKSICDNKLSLLISIVLLAVLTFIHRWPHYCDWTASGFNGVVYKNANDLMDNFLDSKLENPPSNILFMQTGPVVPPTIALSMALKNIDINIDSGALFRATNEFYNAYPNFQWVILQDQALQGCRPDMPSEKILPACLSLIEKDYNYYLLKKISLTHEKSIYIYSKK